jgi:hypothetical protein
VGDVQRRAHARAVLAISGTSLPFNIAHAAGNVVFCLAFGPAFVRALLRFRERFDVRFERSPPATAGGRAVLLGVAALAGRAGPARAADAPTARRRATSCRAQNRDGGFGARPGALGGARDGVGAHGPRRGRAAPAAATGRFLAAHRAAPALTRATSSARSSASSPPGARRAARAA